MRPPRATPDPGTTTAARPGSAPAARGRRAHAGPPADESAERDARLLLTQQTSGPRGRRTLRPRTVRAKVISLLVVPVVSLLALWGFATVNTAQDVARLRQLRLADEEVRAPISTAVTALQAERRAALIQTADPSSAHATALEQQTERTDTALAALRLDKDHTIADTGRLPAGVADRLDRFFDRTHELRADGGTGSQERDESAVYDRYTQAVTAGFGVSGALTGIQDDALGSDARVLLELARADEMLAREDALLAAAALTKRLDGHQLVQFTGAVETRRNLTETAGADLRPPNAPPGRRSPPGPPTTGSRMPRTRCSPRDPAGKPPRRCPPPTGIRPRRAYGTNCVPSAPEPQNALRTAPTRSPAGCSARPERPSSSAASLSRPRW